MTVGLAWILVPRNLRRRLHYTTYNGNDFEWIFALTNNDDPCLASPTQLSLSTCEQSFRPTHFQVLLFRYLLSTLRDLDALEYLVCVCVSVCVASHHS